MFRMRMFFFFAVHTSSEKKQKKTHFSGRSISYSFTFTRQGSTLCIAQSKLTNHRQDSLVWCILTWRTSKKNPWRILKAPRLTNATFLLRDQQRSPNHMYNWWFCHPSERIWVKLEIFHKYGPATKIIRNHPRKNCQVKVVKQLYPLLAVSWPPFVLFRFLGGQSIWTNRAMLELPN